MDAAPLKLTELTALSSHLAQSEPVPADLVVNGVITVRDSTRAALLDWVEAYYVRRGGYEQVSVNVWRLYGALDWTEPQPTRATLGEVRIVPHKNVAPPPTIAYPDA